MNTTVCMYRRKHVEYINYYSLVLTSRQETRNVSNPATATGFMICLSAWYGHSVKVPLLRWVKPCAMRTQNKLLGSLAWYIAN